MRVTASFIVLEREASDGVSWDADMAGATQLARAVFQLEQLGLVDDMAVLTDCETLLARAGVAGLPVRRLCPASATERFNHLTCEESRIRHQLQALDQAGLEGDVHFFGAWRMPLLSSRSWERMYHALLEDRIAARVVPLTAEDPNLYTPLGGNIAGGRLFGVWAHPGRDRQEAPQLYRPGLACVAHLQRIRYPQPLTKGVEISLIEAITTLTPEDVPLARALCARNATAVS
ncbi:hypothetical protein [Megalodesulfovibrio paquesii]